MAEKRGCSTHLQRLGALDDAWTVPLLRSTQYRGEVLSGHAVLGNLDSAWPEQQKQLQRCEAYRDLLGRQGSAHNSLRGEWLGHC